MLTVVVLPLVPVTVSHGAAPSWARMRQASSTSPHTGMPAVAAASMSGSCGGTPGEVTTSSVPGGGSTTCSGPEADVDVEDLEDRRALADRLGLVAGDRRDARAAVGEGVGRREAGDAEADDEDVDPGPVGVAVGQALARLVERVEAHWDPTTHSA